MNLPEYLKALSPDERIKFAAMANTSYGYLTTQLAYGHKKISPELALRLEAASDKALKAHELCPDFPWGAAAEGRCPSCTN